MLYCILTMNNFIDSHYLSLPSQGNVYLSTRFKKVDGRNKILVASLKRKIYLIEYQYVNNYMEPVTKEVYFAYISNNSEITSIDVLNRSEYSDDFVVGIVTTKVQDIGINAQLNLYSEYDKESNFDLNLETIGQSCESFVLNFVPYGLYHVQISPRQISGSYENIWLLPGNDNKIHAYRGYYSERCHAEIPVEDFFIEFCNLPSITLSLDVMYYSDYRNRISCLGCESGFVRCSIVDSENNLVLKNICAEYENPISQVQLFNLHISDPIISKNNVQDENPDFPCKFTILKEESPIINLLVTNTIFHSEVFMDILKHGFSKKHCLYESTQYDVCLCSLIADIDLDGSKEIILGTYGEELLLFKYLENEKWTFIGEKNIPNPVHKLFYEDLTGDGVLDLITVTARGVHIYQHNLKKDIMPILQSRMKALLEQTK